MTKARVSYGLVCLLVGSSLLGVLAGGCAPPGTEAGTSASGASSKSKNKKGSSSSSSGSSDPDSKSGSSAKAATPGGEDDESMLSHCGDAFELDYDLAKPIQFKVGNFTPEQVVEGDTYQASFVYVLYSAAEKVDENEVLSGQFGGTTTELVEGKTYPVQALGENSEFGATYFRVRDQRPGKNFVDLETLGGTVTMCKLPKKSGDHLILYYHDIEFGDSNGQQVFGRAKGTLDMVPSYD